MNEFDSSVRVIARFRPLNDRERNIDARADIDEMDLSVINYYSDKRINIEFVNDANRETSFTLDHILSPSASQKDVFDAVASSTIDDIMDGYNGTIFAYGQTGSGKTYTLHGEYDLPEQLGIIPRAANKIFEMVENDHSTARYSISCSYLEIYKEIINDLLNPGGDQLHIRESPTRGIFVQGLTEEFVTSSNDILSLVMLGNQYRAVASTNMNERSSRSHTVVIIKVRKESYDGSKMTASLNLADLAGSEKVKKSGAVGETLEQAKKINLSLSALGNCINALSESFDKKTARHIPYRDSKLTYILKESLAGNCKTTLVVACSPHPNNVDETLSTLKFAQRAKTIQTHVHANFERGSQELEALVVILKKELATLQDYCKTLEAKLQNEAASLNRSPSSVHHSITDYDPLLAAEMRVEFDQTVEQLQSEILGLKEDANSRLSLIDDLKTKNRELKEKVRVYSVELDSAQSRVSKSDHDASQAKLEVAMLREEIDASSEKIKSLESAIMSTVIDESLGEFTLTDAQADELLSEEASARALLAEDVKLQETMKALDDAWTSVLAKSSNKLDLERLHKLEKSLFHTLEAKSNRIKAELAKTLKQKKIIQSRCNDELKQYKATIAGMKWTLTTSKKSAVVKTEQLNDSNSRVAKLEESLAIANKRAEAAEGEVNRLKLAAALQERTTQGRRSSIVPPPLSPRRRSALSPTMESGDLVSPAIVRTQSKLAGVISTDKFKNMLQKAKEDVQKHSQTSRFSSGTSFSTLSNNNSTNTSVSVDVFTSSIQSIEKQLKDIQMAATRASDNSLEDKVLLKQVVVTLESEVRAANDRCKALEKDRDDAISLAMKKVDADGIAVLALNYDAKLKSFADSLSNYSECLDKLQVSRVALQSDVDALKRRIRDLENVCSQSEKDELFAKMDSFTAQIRSAEVLKADVNEQVDAISRSIALTKRRWMHC